MTTVSKGDSGSSTITIINNNNKTREAAECHFPFHPHHTQDAALARDLSTQSVALTGRFAGGSSAGVQGYAYQNAQGP